MRIIFIDRLKVNKGIWSRSKVPPTLLPWRSQTKTNCGASYQYTPTRDHLPKINVNYSYSLHEKSIKVMSCCCLPSLYKSNDIINITKKRQITKGEHLNLVEIQSFFNVFVHNFKTHTESSQKQFSTSYFIRNIALLLLMIPSCFNIKGFKVPSRSSYDLF